MELRFGEKEETLRKEVRGFLGDNMPKEGAGMMGSRRKKPSRPP
jgi:hypothetical protein